jgi:hypothetical protein
MDAVFGMFANAISRVGLGPDGNVTMAPPGQLAQEGNANTPPASRRALASLPMVKVTGDDILEATNKECLVCLGT